MTGPEAGGEGGGDGRWIETREGGLFFVNALLIFPYVMVLVPLLTRMLVRSRGGLPGESEILDTFPLLAEHLLPRVGWLLVFPLALVIRNLRIESGAWPRAGLWSFLALHAGFLGWTVGVWVGVWGPGLPGGP